MFYAETSLRENVRRQNEINGRISAKIYYRSVPKCLLRENLLKYQKIFGFGQKTGIDLPGEARTDSLMYTLETMDDASLATNAFGQNFNVTMVQMASAFSSLVNGGNYYKPHMVKKITDENGNLIEENKGELLKQTLSKDTCNMVKQYLYKTVSEGTGKTAKVPGYSMGGKTGTAQKYETIEENGVKKTQRAQGKYLVSFIGCVPANNPQLVVYVVIDEPNVEDQAHSTYATEFASSLMKDILPMLEIYPTGKKSDITKASKLKLPSTTKSNLGQEVPDGGYSDSSYGVAKNAADNEEGDTGMNN